MMTSKIGVVQLSIFAVLVAVCVDQGSSNDGGGTILSPILISKSAALYLTRYYHQPLLHVKIVLRMINLIINCINFNSVATSHNDALCCFKIFSVSYGTAD